MNLKLNVPLIEETLIYVNSHPKSHDQQYWGERYFFHRNTLCFGTRAIVLAGGRIQYSWGSAVGVRPGSLVGITGKSGVDIFETARDLLGFTTDQAMDVFYADSLRDVNHAIRGILGAERISNEIARWLNSTTAA